MKKLLSALLTLSMSCSMLAREAPPRSSMLPSDPNEQEGAAEVSAPAPEHAKYKKTTEQSFEDDTVEGDLKKPEGSFVESRTKVKHSALVKVPESLRDGEKTADQTKVLENKLEELKPDISGKKRNLVVLNEKGEADGRSDPGSTTTERERPRNEPPSDPSKLLRHYGVNPTIDTVAEAVSTFSADVDTGSYTLARAYLEKNELPPEAAVRVEEFVNAFDYGYRAPDKEAFAVQVEAFPSPYRKGYHVLHVGLKGREVKAEARKSASLVFVIDVSGSMDAENRLPLAKRAMHLLTDQLRSDDSVAVVVYGTNAHVVLPPTPASEKERIHAALNGLHSEGSTNVQAGLELAYSVAMKAFKGNGINRVVLCSDGVANNGITEADGIFARVKGKASEGVTLTTVGFGMGSYNDVLMERLADQGDGHYAYVDKIEEARRIFVEQLTGTLEVIAKDVKLQLEFNPEAVARYRLLGFENRALDKRDFANDRVDAGELGAGHSVTAIYEIKLKSRAPKFFATFRARFKQPRGTDSALIEKTLPMEVVRDAAGASSGSTRLSLVAAGFAEKLRGSYWARGLSWEELLATWDSLPEALKGRQQSQELHTLILTARRLDNRPDRFESEVPLAQMDFDRIPVLR